MSIFTERDDDRMDKSQARNSIERRDALIEEFFCALCDSHDHLIAFSPAGRSDLLIKHIRSLVEKAEREGYGQGPGAA